MSIAFERAKKTFLNRLRSQGKAFNTVRNYVSDLDELGRYCDTYSLELGELGIPQLEAFHEVLKKRGLRVNSRRRKIMTAKAFLRFLSAKIDLSLNITEKWIAPDKMEKPPKLVSRDLLRAIVAAQPETEIGVRNRALILVLVETGALVTEVLQLTSDDCTWEKSGAKLRIMGKRARVVRVGPECAKALRDLRSALRAAGATRNYFFYGYSKSARNPDRLTSRGVEILFRNWSKVFRERNLKPRTLRHIFVMTKLASGATQAEIMALLGLRTTYSFRSYDQLTPALQPEQALKPALRNPASVEKR